MYIDMYMYTVCIYIHYFTQYLLLLYNYMYIFAYTIRCYGNRQSLESGRRERLSMSYESVHDAHEKNAAKG